MSLTSRRAALVTGGARRIGKNIALALAEKGLDIALHCNRSQDAAKEVQSAIRGFGCRCEILSADLSREDEVEGLMEKVAKEFPSVDLLVNNASVFEPGKLIETDTRLLDLHMDVNFKAPFLLIRDFANFFGKGHVINILDTRIFGTPSGYVAYSASKAALWALSRMAARELAPEIRVNAIAPGLILPPPGRGREYLDDMARKVPLKRSGSPESVVFAVRYLLESDFVTGECLMVDGGEWLK